VKYGRAGKAGKNVRAVKNGKGWGRYEQ
jgi:hypothetical protein